MRSAQFRLVFASPRLFLPRLPRAPRLAYPRPLILPLRAMATAHGAYHGVANGNSTSGSTDASSHTLTALSRWSILSKQLPTVDGVESLHVYDFDNTLFRTPLPNSALWTPQAVGQLTNLDTFVNGGWWHDSRILAATGEGLAKEEEKAWDGWWNEKIVELVRLSTAQPGVLTVLLTGRSEQGFSDLIKRMVKSKGLEFDMVILKPKVSPTNRTFTSTMHFKQIYLDTLMETYANATEIRIYEDRPKHTKGFQDFFAAWNQRKEDNAKATRGPLTADVVQVADGSATLDPVVEVAEVQHMVNLHNDAVTEQKLPRDRLQLRKSTSFTMYLVGAEGIEKLQKLSPVAATDPDWNLMGNNILICPRSCSDSLLEKVGGIGSRLTWEVTGLGNYTNTLWAARIRPVPSTAAYHTENSTPSVILALKKGGRPIHANRITSWQPIPPEESFVFETVVGEKGNFRIEPEGTTDDNLPSGGLNRGSKRKHPGDQDWQHRNAPSHARGHHTSARGGRGRGGGGGGGGGAGAPGGRGNRNASRGGGRGGRGRGGGNHYRSLDDMSGAAQNPYGNFVSYDENYPPLGPKDGSRNQGGRPSGQQGNDADLQDYY